MFSDQRVVCGRVIEGDPLPLLGDMTAVARLPQSTFMPVLLSMTIKADLGGLLKSRSLMAFQTGRVPVTPDQSKPGLVVVEVDLLPRSGRMTGFALTAQNPFVFVLFLMASDAGHRWGGELIRRVTLLATDLLVLPLQKKPRLGMIELDLLPIVGGVASLAGLPQPPLVFVLFRVAGKTVARGFAIFVF
jgi:hypothetical protein